MRFNGTIEQNTPLPGSDATLMRSVAPAGDYIITITSGSATGSAAFKVAAVTSSVPSIQNLLAHPETISPNQDAIDDVGELTSAPT